MIWDTQPSGPHNHHPPQWTIHRPEGGGEAPRGLREAAEAPPHPVRRRLNRQGRVAAVEGPSENHLPVAAALRHLHRRPPPGVPRPAAPSPPAPHCFPQNRRPPRPAPAATAAPAASAGLCPRPRTAPSPGPGRRRQPEPGEGG